MSPNAEKSLSVPLSSWEFLSPADRRRRVFFHRRLEAWFRREGRHDLPWKRDRRGYAVWVSEIMLQQTTVETVRGYYDRFLRRFPTLRALAEADLDDVLALWAGLGYYRRAHHLHRASRLIVERHGGRMPQRVEDLVALPGIGRSTAGAIVSLAYDRPAVVLDTNVRRVLERFWKETHDRLGGGEKALWTLARGLLPEAGGRAYTQALMDLGALLCRPREPVCGRCPLVENCPGPEAPAVEARNRASSSVRRQKTRVLKLLYVRDREGRFLLTRRPTSGIWGGLWCLPEAGRTTGVEPSRARRLHRLSHLDLDIRLVVGTEKMDLRSCGEGGEERRWANVSECARLGLPPVVREMLESLAKS